MTEKVINGVEITVYENDGSVSIKPIYEAHSAERVLEIVNATNDLVQGTGKSISWNVF